MNRVFTILATIATFMLVAVVAYSQDMREALKPDPQD